MENISNMTSLLNWSLANQDPSVKLSEEDRERLCDPELLEVLFPTTKLKPFLEQAVSEALETRLEALRGAFCVLTFPVFLFLFFFGVSVQLTATGQTWRRLPRRLTRPMRSFMQEFCRLLSERSKAPKHRNVLPPPVSLPPFVAIMPGARWRL